MVSKIEPDRYANTGFSVADTPTELNALLFQQIMRKSGPERLEIGCQMADSARALVWSGIPKNLPEAERRALFLQRFYGENDPTVAAITHLRQGYGGQAGRRTQAAGASRSSLSAVALAKEEPSPEHPAPACSLAPAAPGASCSGNPPTNQTPDASSSTAH